MLNKCNFCIHNRGGCRSRDEDGVQFCDYEFNPLSIDRNDPSTWPEDDDEEDEEDEDLF